MDTTLKVFGKMMLISSFFALLLMGCASNMPHSEGAREVFYSPIPSNLETVTYTAEEIDFDAIILPPQSITKLKLKTYCLDHYRPAPPAGESMKLVPVKSLIDSKLVPLYVELMKYSHQDSSNYQQIQRIVWNFRHAVTEETQSLTLQPEDRELLRSLDPESESILRSHYNKKTAQDFGFKMLEAFLSPEGKELLNDLRGIGLDLSQPKRTFEDANRSVDEMLTALETMAAGQLPSSQDNAYSFLEDGVAVQVSHSGGARSTHVTVRNTTDHPVTFQPANYVYDSAAKYQPLANGGVEGMEQQVPELTKHVFIAFSGFGVSNDDLAPTTEKIAKTVLNKFYEGNRSDELLSVSAYASDTDDDVKKYALEFIEQNISRDSYNKQTGKIILYGYSWGGDTAVELSEALSDKGYQVDLLFTVDASTGPFALGRNSEIPTNVKANVNYYTLSPETHDRFEGMPHQAEDPSKTTVINHRCPDDINHIEIDEYVEAEAVEEITNSLTRSAEIQTSRP